MAKRRPAPRIKAAQKRKRRQGVHVRGYCRRAGEAASRKAERVRKAMPF